MYLIVGLGNPGNKYKNTRHNLGFMVADAFAKKVKSEKVKVRSDERFNAEIVDAVISGQKIILAKPQTFMNASGFAVGKIANYYKIEPKDIWVIHDDIDLPLGRVKIRLGGASAGHRGVQSIIEELGTDGFIRVRLGVGHPRNRTANGDEPGNISVDSYVLRNFDISEKSELKSMMKKVVDVIEIGVKKGIETAMNRFNE